MDAQSILDRVEAACKRCGRDPRTVRILGASKKQPPDKINAFIAFCNARGEQALIGENYVQEWAEKKDLIQGDFQCHFIGHLQSNKAKLATSIFSGIQCVDSVKLAHKLDGAVTSNSLPVFIQVNISDDEAKSGIAPAGTLELAKEIAAMNNLQLAGLMTIPKLYQEPGKVRLDYRALKALSEEISTQLHIPLELSMGMSDDFEIAIEEGATIVRVGTLLFGAR